MNRNLGVLISGRGSNLQAIIDAIGAGRLDARVALVVSNRADAYGLERAAKAGIETRVRPHKAYATREAFEQAMIADLKSKDVGLVCLAGFMRLLGPTFINAFPGAILNIHPALLPSFPGLNGARQAVDYGVKASGATVHFVNAELDAGPIVMQATVPVYDDDTDETLAERILVEEHWIYPAAIQLVLDGTHHLVGRRFIRRSNTS
jgi:phosphoribosylglycinamide formyltransferase 1